MLSGPYLPDSVARKRVFVVIEGVSRVGKSTLARILADRLGATTLHTLPEPMTSLASAVNTQARPLPQFAFYLSGLLHASDVATDGLTRGPVVADRYASSVMACHAAVNGVGLAQVVRLMEPFGEYLTVPDRTYYLLSSKKVLRARMAGKTDLKQDDLDLFDVPGRLTKLLENFAAVAEADPTAAVLDTDGQSPDDLATTILEHLEAHHA